MDDKFFVGIARISLFFRQSRSLKDKRSVLQSLKQKLRNEGWSVVEVGHQDDFKRAFLGFSYVASSAHALDLAFDKVSGHLIGNFEVVSKTRELLEFEADPSFDDSSLTRSILGDVDD
ncbi:MAG: DUF503 domain-containing protein [Proteobacteria bacterium]|nr:DUF503 domain-containing protein [Pseudomonadota bacterium]